MYDLRYITLHVHVHAVCVLYVYLKACQLLLRRLDRAAGIGKVAHRGAEGE